MQPKARDENPRCLELQEQEGFPLVSHKDPHGGHTKPLLAPVGSAGFQTLLQFLAKLYDTSRQHSGLWPLALA